MSTPRLDLPGHLHLPVPFDDARVDVLFRCKNEPMPCQGDIDGPVGVSWTGLLLAPWAAGAAIVLFRWAREWHQVRRYTRGATPIASVG